MPNRSIGRYLIAAVITALLSNHQTKTDQPPPKSDDDRHQRYERVYWLVSTMISALAFAAAIGAAWFAGGAYFAAQEQVVQAKRQADIAQKSLEEQNAPLIGTSGITWSAPLVSDTDNAIKIHFGNIGKAPTFFATVLNLAISEQFESEFDAAPMDFGENPFCNTLSYYREPVTTAYPTQNPAVMTTGIKVDKRTVNAMLAPKSNTTIALQGRIFYKQDEIIHWTGFCYIAGKGNKTADLSNSPICVRGNFFH